MFAGLLGLQCNGNGSMDPGRSLLHHYEVIEGGGKALESAGESCRKRPQRRPGYMRADPPRPQSTTSGDEDEEEEEEEEEEAEGRNAPTRNGGPGCPGRKGQSSIIDSPNTPYKSPVLTPQEPLLNPGLEPDVESRASWLAPRSTSCLRHPPEAAGRSFGKGAVHHQGGASQSGTPGRYASAGTRQTPGGDSFNSSFSFIRQSLSASQGNDITGVTSLPVPRPARRSPVPLKQSTSTPVAAALTAAPTKTPMPPASRRAPPKLCVPFPTPGVHSQREEGFWQGGQWGGRGEPPSDHPDGESFSLGTEEFPSSLSVDSDTASSVTSGYESATPASSSSSSSSDQGWDPLVRKYEGVLRECLQNNRANTKIESMMLKLQRLQQKAILDDDYDTAERFGKKLAELCLERGALKLGLPSRQPGVASFLQRLTQAVNSALQRTQHCQRRESSEPDAVERSSSQLLNPRELLVQEKHLVEEEMEELRRRLALLEERRGRLEERLQRREEEEDEEEEEEERGAGGGEELGVSVLRGLSTAQLEDMSRALNDLVTAECRADIAVTPPPPVLRIQEQEKALNLSIKEATAKVVTSQRLGGSLRRKVSETETQLLALHEAKMAAISGSDFGSAKELKVEMKAVYQERDRLERLARRLQRLSWGNGQELARMKEQQQQLRAELEQREAQHESLLKENAAKYIELLEDRLPSCGCPPLEKVWEADLEACHLFLRGPQLRTPSYSGADSEEPPGAVAVSVTAAGSLFALMPTSTKEEEEEDCAMLTALGGRWCPEANLQHSEFTKKLEEFLFCMEDCHTEDECGGGEGAGQLTEQCDMISDRLMTLEDDMQMAILNRDHALTQSLAKEVQEVKATLQAMLAQLKEEEEEEEEVEEEKGRQRTAMHDCDLMENGIEEEEEAEKDDEEEEDQYFSDSWDI